MPFLKLLSLLIVSLPQLFGLLLMPLFHLLPLRLAVSVLRNTLVFLLLFLLESLPLLLLLRKQFLLLLLVFPVAVGIACFRRRRPFYRWEVFGMHTRPTALSSRLLGSTIGRRLIRSAGFSGSHNRPTTKLRRPGGAGYRRFAMIG